MPTYLFAYHGGMKPETPEEAEMTRAAWAAWFRAMGPAVIDAGNAVGSSRTVRAGIVSNSGGANPVSGYSLIRAATLTAAIDHARGCPMVQDRSGTIEVAEIIEIGSTLAGCAELGMAVEG